MTYRNPLLGIRLLHIFPLVLMLGGFILAILALFAGKDDGFMEEYATVRLNMTNFAKDFLIDGGGKNDKGGIGGGIGGFSPNKTNNTSNNITFNLPEKLGINEWYSIHILQFCQGNFKDDPPGIYVVRCTDSSPGHRINFTRILDDEITAGPANLTLSDFPWPPGVERRISKFIAALHGATVFYVLAIAFVALSLICNTGAFFYGRSERHPTVLNTVFALAAWVTLGLGSVIASWGAGDVVEVINDAGEQIGVAAMRGMEFVVLTWTAFGVVGVVAVYWANEYRMMTLVMEGKNKENAMEENTENGQVTNAANGQATNAANGQGKNTGNGQGKNMGNGQGKNTGNTTGGNPANATEGNPANGRWQPVPR